MRKWRFQWENQGRKYGGGRVNPPAFENFVFFAQKNEKNCAFESILVTNPYERTCYTLLLPDLETLEVDVPPALETELRPWRKQWDSRSEANVDLSKGLTTVRWRDSLFTTNNFANTTLHCLIELILRTTLPLVHFDELLRLSTFLLFNSCLHVSLRCQTV